jgi:DNA polymerase I
MYASIEDVDVNYYTERQIVPAAARILQFFGVTEERLLEGEKKSKQGTLADFAAS